MVRVFIFDFDGPILDSFQGGLQRLQLLLERHGVEFTQARRETVCAVWGQPPPLVIEAFGLGRQLSETLYREWVAFDNRGFLPLIEGATDVLRWAGREGIMCTLLTSRHREALMPTLEHYHLTAEFHVIETADDTPFHKPDHRVFQGTFERLRPFGVGLTDCVYIGDTIADAMAGVGAGIETVHVLTGPHDAEFFRKQENGAVWAYFAARPRNILNSIRDLPHWLAKR